MINSHTKKLFRDEYIIDSVLVVPSGDFHGTFRRSQTNIISSILCDCVIFSAFPVSPFHTYGEKYVTILLTLRHTFMQTFALNWNLAMLLFSKEALAMKNRW